MDVMTKKRTGIIIVPPGVFVSVQEKLTVDYLVTQLGHDVLFQVPSRRRGVKTPDIEMEGVKWEIKSPSGRSPRTIENNLRAALKQSRYIILDLRNMDGRIPTDRLLRDAEYRFRHAKTIKYLMVITRQGKHIDFKR